MSDGHCFISYSNREAEDFGPQLANELEGGDPYIKTWYDKRDIPVGQKWDSVISKAIGDCKCFLFVVTRDSIAEDSICMRELSLALSYKKPIFPICLQPDVEFPWRIRDFQGIDFCGIRRKGMAQLRLAIQRLETPEGQLDLLQNRLSAAERDLNNAKGKEENHIKSEIEGLKAQIQQQEIIVRDSRSTKIPKGFNLESNNKYQGGAKPTPIDGDEIKRIMAEMEMLKAQIRRLENNNSIDPKERKAIEEKLLHLEFIQKAITSLSANSVQMKRAMLIVVAALLAIAVITKETELVLVATLPGAFFWGLDAYYLQQERKFRGLYNDAAEITKINKISPFAMRPDLYQGKKYSYWDVFGSVTIMTLYLPVILILVLIYFFL